MKNYEEAILEAVKAFNNMPKRRAFVSARLEQAPENPSSWYLYFKRRRKFCGRKEVVQALGVFEPFDADTPAETNYEWADLQLFESFYKKALEETDSIDPMIPCLGITESVFKNKLKEVVPENQHQEVFELVWLGLYTIRSHDGKKEFLIKNSLADEKLAPSKFILEW
ncbi:MAG: hypothetical protein WC120_00845 [Parcubacteria group bacterium]